MRLAKMFWHAQWQKCFGMRKNRRYLYALAQVNLVCAGAGQAAMRKRRTFWYAQEHVNLVCAGACHFIMRRRISFCYAQAQVRFSCARAAHLFFLCAGHLFGTLLLKFHLKHILNFFPRTYLYFSNNLQVSFFYPKLVFLQSHSITSKCVSYPLNNFGP